MARKELRERSSKRRAQEEDSASLIQAGMKDIFKLVLCFPGGVRQIGLSGVHPGDVGGNAHRGTR